MKLLLLSLCVVSAYASVEFCSRPEFDCLGRDIRHFHGTDEECKTACVNEPRCKSVQALGNNCWLKHHACTPNELRAFKAGQDFVKLPSGKSCKQFKPTKHRYCHRDNFDCLGHDIYHIGGVTERQCKTYCDYKEDCKSIQFIDGNCWVKNHACTNEQLRRFKKGNDFVKVAPGASCAAYKKTKSSWCKRANMDCAGHDIVSYNDVAEAECKTLCSWNSLCKSIQSIGTNCWLKRHQCTNSELRPFLKASDLVKIKAGGKCTPFKKPNPRYCERAGFDCLGRDIRHVKATLPQCQTFCSYDSNCKSIQSIGDDCWLKRHACKKGELRPWNGGRDHVKVDDRRKSCAKALKELE